jgi:hypothetical protein
MENCFNRVVDDDINRLNSFLFNFGIATGPSKPGRYRFLLIFSAAAHIATAVVNST